MIILVSFGIQIDANNIRLQAFEFAASKQSNTFVRRKIYERSDRNSRKNW